LWIKTYRGEKLREILNENFTLIRAATRYRDNTTFIRRNDNATLKVLVALVIDNAFVLSRS
jgi:hypothetical protein